MIFFDNALFCTGLDSADEFFVIILPLIEFFMTLITAVKHSGLVAGEDFTDKRPFSAFAIGEKNLSWD